MRLAKRGHGKKNNFVKKKKATNVQLHRFLGGDLQRV